MPGSMQLRSGAKDEDKGQGIFLSKIFLEFLVNSVKVCRERLHLESPVAKGNLLTNGFVLLEQAS